MITFEEFKTNWREKEAREGTKQHVVNGNILPDEPLSDEKLRELYDMMQDEKPTGVIHHGEIMTESPALTLKNLGF